MPSPFPGMDPYLEDPSFWPDVHGTLVTAIRAAITPQLPPGFYAELDQHVWLEEEDPVLRERRGRPDVYITSAAPPRRPKASAGRVAVAVPTVRVKVPSIEKVTGPRYVRIMSQRSRRVVTAIELLSPSNKKAGPEMAAYLAKRSEYVATGTNLVEIDLLRAGTRLPVGNDKLPDTDYYAFVTLAPSYYETDVWAFTVRDEFPRFPIPLTPGSDPIPLDLKPCLDRAYDEANYGPQIDYTQPPVPALRTSDAEWCAELLKRHAKKKR